MRDALIVSLLSLVPRKLAARGMGLAARTGASRLLARAFVAAYGVDLSEAAAPAGGYRSLEDLFTRRLLPGARPIDADPDALVSPVDGAVAWCGTTIGGVFEVAPGRPHRVGALLGAADDGEHDVIVLYLSPRDYHRVHCPRAGAVTRWSYVPGTLWPVFPAAVRRVPELFCRNERVVVDLQTDAGLHRVVLVGAFGVGRIGLAFADLLTNTDGAPHVEAPAPPVGLARGDELGVFHLGSTVILVAPPGTWRFTAAPGEAVRLGQRLGVRA